MIYSIHNQDPSTPLDSQRPGIARYQIGAYWVDAIGEPTLAEVEAHRNPPKTPIEEIRAMEQAQNVQDAMQRASRMASLLATRAEMVRQMGARAPSVIITHDQAHNWLVVNDKYYKLLWELEQAIEPLRRKIP